MIQKVEPIRYVDSDADGCFLVFLIDDTFVKQTEAKVTIVTLLWCLSPLYIFCPAGMTWFATKTQKSQTVQISMPKSATP